MPTPTEAAVVAGTAVWVRQWTEASENLKANATEAAATLWEAFDDWYNPVAVAKLGKEVAALSQAAQHTTAGLSAAYTANVTAVLTGKSPGSLPRKPWSDIRNGADMPRVHTRPAQVYLHAIAEGKDHQAAINLAIKRAESTMQSDITLQDRQTQQKILDQLGVLSYRRIIHPELSRTGTCGLCIAAASKPYNTGHLMPLHPPTCKCTVMPIIGDMDPGNALNEEDLAALYEEAGGKDKVNLARTRYQVNEHGELGPVITKQGDAFRDSTQSWLANDPERAKRILERALPTLEQMEVHAESGVPHAEERLEYQRRYVAMLERIVNGQANAA